MRDPEKYTWIAPDPAPSVFDRLPDIDLTAAGLVLLIIAVVCAILQ